MIALVTGAYFGGSCFPVMTIVNLIWAKGYSIQVMQMPGKIQIACIADGKAVASGMLMLDPQTPEGVTK